MHSLAACFKQKTAYEISLGLVGSEMCIRDRLSTWHSLDNSSDEASVCRQIREILGGGEEEEGERRGI